jgi:hypothetical protein
MILKSNMHFYLKCFLSIKWFILLNEKLFLAFLQIILLAYNSCTGGYIVIFTYVLPIYLS